MPRINTLLSRNPLKDRWATATRTPGGLPQPCHVNHIFMLKLPEVFPKTDELALTLAAVEFLPATKCGYLPARDMLVFTKLEPY